MFKKHKIKAFQLLEALIVLSLVSSLLGISLLPLEKITKFSKKDIDILYQLLVREQKHSFLSHDEVQVVLTPTEVRVWRKGSTYILKQKGQCQSNFEANTIILTDRGTWERGGSIYCGNQTIAIGIGNSVPKME